MLLAFVPLLLPAAASADGLSDKVSFQPQVKGLRCLKPDTVTVLSELVAKIGPVEITSTCGGRHARRSQHYLGRAIDFRPLATSPRKAAAAARSLAGVGGVGTYSNGLVHADVGELEISWHGHGRSRRASASRYSHYARLARDSR
ncbi:DUF882 domain-containing protein [Bosea sp. (in: a-proteobacteria)]|uniref:DUF882 domain-containing protein n=1 Tax=Bosea sp. (in: a-proteobacteria) TaxID=1871050 RepID=UPI0026164FC2|nr:DUF882 domain-containing protein [Bosea sp. (in: a-proteobacteria)]MCO5089397.1 DUF882 domain-containing protein [Bosea sp. (in: a-proteobacteria)]